MLVWNETIWLNVLITECKKVLLHENTKGIPPVPYPVHGLSCRVKRQWVLAEGYPCPGSDQGEGVCIPVLGPDWGTPPLSPRENLGPETMATPSPNPGKVIREKVISPPPGKWPGTRDQGPVSKGYPLPLPLSIPSSTSLGELTNKVKILPSLVLRMRAVIS